MRPYRKERVASAVQTIVSEAIARRVNDPRLEPLTTVTRVAMTGDLLIARVYVRVPGGDTKEKKTLSALHHAAGFIQRMVAEGLRIRQCPQLQFFVDEPAKQADFTLRLIEENERRRGESHPSVDTEEKVSDDSPEEPE